MTKIEWTEKTWNPVVGCSLVSPGCTNCYAMRMAARLEAMAGDGLDDNGYAIRGTHPLGHYRGLTRTVKGKAVWTGKLALAPERTLLEPPRRKKPTMWFVNSMGDLFHEDVPDAWIDRVFAVMALCPQHTFQVLTKRSARMRAYFEEISETLTARQRLIDAFGAAGITADHSLPLPNVWLGISAEDQRRADERIPDLLATPAAVRFVSAEPLLGSINFGRIRVGALGWQDVLQGWRDCQDYPGREERLDWIIVGGESGPGARPMHPDWARKIRDDCQAAGVAFFFKQWGEHAPVGRVDRGSATDPGEFGWERVGKARAGRMLDGREWNEMPVAHHLRSHGLEAVPA